MKEQMMNLTIERENFSVVFEKTAKGARITSGHFGAICIKETPLFTLTVRNVATKEESLFSSMDEWGEVTVRERGGQIRFFFF